MSEFIANTQLPLAVGTDSGPLLLQQCGECHAVSYPPRELCGHCLVDALSWQPQPDAGQLLATTTLHHSLEPALQQQLPIVIGSIKLAAGPVAIAYLSPPSAAIGSAVTVTIGRDSAGNPVLQARPTNPQEQQP